MKFLADESVDHRITLYLRSIGFDVLSIHDIETGISDDKVLQIANNESAILLTEDRDFGFLVIQLGRSNCGVILIRIFKRSIEERISLIEKAIIDYQDQLRNNFVVINANSVRIRFL